MTGIMIFLLGFFGYFLVRNRFALISLLHDLFVLRAQKDRPRKKLQGNRVMFFEMQDVWPEEGEDKKAS
jgi:hypothetical protein